MEKKIKILIITIVLASLIFVKVENEPKKNIYISKTNVKPISNYELIDYEIYNNYIDSLNNNINKYPKDYTNNDQSEIRAPLRDPNFPKIDNKYLFKLFIDKMVNNKILFEIIQNENFIKKEEFSNDIEYEKAILNFLSTIKYSEVRKKSNLIENEFRIQVTTSRPTEWKKILVKLENSINHKIKEYLKNQFEKLLSSEKRIMKFKIEDILLEQSNYDENDEYSLYLNKMKNKLENTTTLNRLGDIFNEIEVLNSNSFKAASIRVNSTSFEIFTKKSSITNEMRLFIAVLVGLIIGLIYVFFEKIVLRQK